MRPNSKLRVSRPVVLGAAAAMITIPGGAVALAAGQADAQSAIQINVTPVRTSFGRAVTVTGQTTQGERLQLQFASAGTTTWRALGSTSAGSRGQFRFAVQANQNGALRVVPSTFAATNATSGPQQLTAPVTPSAPTALSVAGRLTVHRVGPVTSGAAHVTGRLAPALARRRVALLARVHGGWQEISAARTGGDGRFSLPVPSGRANGRRLQVRFAGDRLSAPATADGGTVASLHPSIASWYDDGGATACGFHAGLGVANRTLPCGTKVVISYGGRTVTATVDDRGPFVTGRDWDLNQNVASALGFDGVGTVWTSI